MEKKINKNLLFNLLAIVLIALFCVSLTPKTLQNDTFYTIKIGEHIIQNSEVDMMDPFSWHENLEYTYPHWLYDVMIYLIYNLGGMLGIYLSTCVFSIILGISIYIVNSKLAKNKVISFFITVGVMYLLRDYITARAQLVTFTLFILEIFCIEKLVETNKKLYSISLVILSILIANLHSAVWPFMFVLYLPYVVEYFMSIFEEHFAKKYNKEVKQGKKILIIKQQGVKTLIIILIISILAGFFTPLGATPYTYLFKTMAGNTTQNINEHQPLVLINNTDLICAIIIILGLLIFTNAKIRLSDLLMLCGLTFLMFYSKRQSTIWVIIGSIIVNRLIFNWITKYSKDFDTEIIKKLMNKFGIFTLTVLILILSLYFIKPKIGAEYIDSSTYPVEMSEFIINYFKEQNIDLSEVRLYNEYNYGSYLLYKDIPVFIDSRADLYSPEFNEGVDVFTDFIQSSNLNVYFEDIFEKYNITHVILYRNSKINMIIEDAKLDNYKLLKKDKYFVFYEIEK